MTTPKSSFSQRRLLACYKDALIHHKNAGLFYGVLSFVFFPLQFILTVLRHEPQFITNNLFGYAMCYNGVSAFFFTALTLAAALIIPTNIFSFMHARRAVDVYHSLPYKRSEMLLGYSAAGLTLLFVPIVIDFLVIMAFGFKVALFSQSLVFLEMLCWLVSVAVVFMLTVFASVQVGSVFDTSTFSLVLNGSIAALYLLVCLLSDSFLYGYSSSDEMINTAYKLSPVSTIIGRIGISRRNGAELIAQNNIAILIWFVVAIVITVLAVYFYNRRKSEQAEVLGTIGLLSAYVRAVGTLLAGCLIGAAFAAVFSINNKFYVLGCIFIGAIIAYMIGDVILSRSVKSLKKSAPWALMMSVGTAIFVAVFLFGGLGFEARVPAPSDIQSIEIKNYRGRFENFGTYGNSTLLQSEQAIQTVVEMHAAHLRYMNENKQNHTDISSTVLPERKGQTFWMTITYNLKNGRTMLRSYSMGQEEVGQYLLALETNPEFITKNNELFTLQAEDVKQVELFNTMGDKDTQAELSEQQTTKLIHALQQDILAQPSEELHGSKVLGRISFEVIRYRDASQETEEYTYAYPEKATVESDRIYTESYTISISPSFGRTLTLLEEYGLADTLTNSIDEVSNAYIGLATNNYYSTIIKDSNRNVAEDITYSIYEGKGKESGAFVPLPTEEFSRLYPKMVNIHDSSEPMAVVAIENTQAPRKISGYYFIPLTELDPALVEKIKVLSYQSNGEWILRENGITVTEEWRTANQPINNY